MTSMAEEEKTTKEETKTLIAPGLLNQCPVNNSWLLKMRNIFPEDIWKNSKLAKYDQCLPPREAMP